MTRYKIEVECDPGRIPDLLKQLGDTALVVGYKEFAPAEPEEIKAARDLYQDSSGDIEIDDDAGTSETDDGVWVQAWVWLSNEDLGIGEEDVCGF